MSESTFELDVNDYGTPFFAVCKMGANGPPRDLSSSTGVFYMETADATQTVKVNGQAVTIQPTQTFTADATADLVTANDHKCEEGDQVVLTTTTTLPAGLSLATRYFVKNKRANSFQLSATEGGAAIDITGAGTGTHSFAIIGSFQYDFQVANTELNTAGPYSAYMVETITATSKQRTYPVARDGIGRGFPIQINAR